MTNIAVFTMVYNETRMLPLWIRHYGTRFGENNCFIIDHGSDDGSTNHIGYCNLIRIPRSPQDNEKRTNFVSDILTSFLNYYDYVIYTDCDEMLVADPNKYSSIHELLNIAKPNFITSIGLDVVHMIDKEPLLDPTRLISEQRSYIHYTSAMNKLSITSVPMRWSPGFHSGLQPAHFDGLYLFHMRYFDIESTLIRLNTTRNMPWKYENSGKHQRIDDDTMIKWILHWNNLPIVDDDLSFRKDGLIAGYIDEFVLHEKQCSAGYMQVNTTLFGKEIIKLPNHMIGTF